VAPWTRLAIFTVSPSGPYLNLKNLRIRNPDVLEYMAELAGVELNVAEQHLSQKQSEQAIDILNQAEKKLSQLVKREPDSPRYQRDLAAARRTRAKIHVGGQQYLQALQELGQARQILEDLVQRYPTDEDYADQLKQTQAVIDSIPPAATRK
jgi:tetratricopeptide (TPR) repeat protein